MVRLVKGLYGNQFKATGDMFGLRCGQCRGDDFIHNGGWYNKEGEKLGWGDLSSADLATISSSLENDELFIILHEGDSFWSFVERPGVIGSMCQTKPDIEAPGVEYVADKCAYIIAKDQLYYVDRYDDTREEFRRGALLFKVLSRKAAKHLIAGTPITA